MFSYPTLPSSYANPAGTATAPGFTYRTVLAVGAPTLASTLVRARAQLAGTLVNPDTQEPFENGAELGPNPDGSFNVDTVLDFDDDGAVSGNFDRDLPFPGLPTGANNWFSTEAWLFLDLPAGYHRLGVNSDDGFEVSAGTPAQGAFTAQTVLPSALRAGATWERPPPTAPSPSRFNPVRVSFASPASERSH